MTGRWYVTLECDTVAHGKKSVGWWLNMESSMQHAERCSSEWQLVGEGELGLVVLFEGLSESDTKQEHELTCLPSPRYR